MRSLLLMLITFVSVHAASIALPDNFRSHFTQKITNTKKRTIVYKGTVRFSDRTRLKWEYTEPTKKEVCTDGVELVVVDHDLEQVSNYRIEKGFDLAAIVKDVKLHRESVYLAKYEGKTYTIQVDRKGRLSRIAYFDELDNSVLIIFDNMKYGKGNLSTRSMQCDVPKDYDLIRG